jgi:K+-sensing histidine kinase KdpD
MSFGNPNGRRPRLKQVIAPRPRKPSPLRRHPYITAILLVAVAALSVFLVQSLLKFPPLIIFAGAVGFCFPVLGVRPGLLALFLSVLVADFLFIGPLLTNVHAA